EHVRQGASGVARLRGGPPAAAVADATFFALCMNQARGEEGRFLRALPPVYSALVEPLRTIESGPDAERPGPGALHAILRQRFRWIPESTSCLPAPLLRRIERELLEPFHFSGREGFGLGPSLLGSIFEQVTLAQEEASGSSKRSRRHTGSYYTPAAIVA